SVGPTAGNLVAQHLTALLDHRPDEQAHIVRGRFLLPDGTRTRRAAGAVGIELPDGRAFALAGITGFGDHPVAGPARFMDYGGAVQDGPDIRTRGMVGADGIRWYLDVYPTADSPALGAMRGAPTTAGVLARGKLPTTGGAPGLAGVIVLVAGLAVVAGRRRLRWGSA